MAESESHSDDSLSGEEKQRNKRKSDSASTSSACKKRRVAAQVFKKSYSNDWPCIGRSRLGPNHAYCTLCRADFSIKHGGRNDCLRHTESAKHKSFVSLKQNRSVAAFFSKGSLLFSYLPKFMVSIFTIPHSSAHCERVFSCVRKNRTDQRASLGEDTMEALMVVKSQPGGSLNRHLTKEDLIAIKKCYADSLRK